MQLSAPEPDVRVQRINILLINKNSVDTYAFFGSLKQKYFACSACRTQADQVSVNWMRCRVFFFGIFFVFPDVLFYRTNKVSLAGRRWWAPLVFKFGELFIFRMDLSSLADSDCIPAPLVLQCFLHLCNGIYLQKSASIQPRTSPSKSGGKFQ